MRRFFEARNHMPIHLLAAAAMILLALLPAARATPAEDQALFQGFFTRQHPELPVTEYAFGNRTFDKEARSALDDPEKTAIIQETVKEGARLFATSFRNGSSYVACFRANGVGIASDYPYFDVLGKEVRTLPMDVNECRVKNGEQPLPYGSAELTAILAYMADTSRKNIVNVILVDDPAAREAYENGKRFYFTRRGQMNLACAHCHLDSAGKTYAGTKLSPALGQVSPYPAYSAARKEIVTLHGRFDECMRLMGAKPFAAQGKEYRELEYFLTYMSNGVPLNAPGVRD